MFKNLNIRYKLMICYWIVFILSISIGSVCIYAFVRKTIEGNIRSELRNTTTTILNMVETSAAVSIKNHLRAMSEKNNEIAGYFYRQYREGRMTEEAAKEKAAALMLCQSIGKSGYIYCLDSSGKVVVHPLETLRNSDVSRYDFVQAQIRRKSGYFEYEWQNPGDDHPRPKAIYSTYFEPWDWVISVSAYRKEFKELVNVDDFKDSILSLHFGETGYSFVLDSKGTAIIHPKLQGVNIPAEKDLPNYCYEYMLEHKKGQLVYLWKNPGETEPRKKLVIFNYIPEYEWMVASSSYLEEFYGPLSTVRNLILLTVIITIMLGLPITYTLSESITNPLKRLMTNFNKVAQGNFTVRMEQRSNDELGLLATYFNSFMERLERYNIDLNEQIQVRKKAETALRESEQRYRTVMETAPDPIVVFDMKGKVTLINPAFTHVFGLSLMECMGESLDRFVPHENRPETRMMREKLLSGKTLSAVETRRYTKGGAIRSVSVSGAVNRDPAGRPVGSVMILRDITDKRRLEKQVMGIGDRERQKIGQDLHDDLCPHLIGTLGLTTVLKENLINSAPRNYELADKIVQLIEDAIAKSRSLARGLCPVHLVAHGLTAALAEMAQAAEAVSGIPCRFTGDDTVVLDENTEATHIYYIAREATNNAVKHAGATQIRIDLSREKDVVHLRVRDNGRGMDENSGTGENGGTGGMGLQIMQYRARIIGGSVEFGAAETGDGEAFGTMVHVSMKNTSAGA